MEDVELLRSLHFEPSGEWRPPLKSQKNPQPKVDKFQDEKVVYALVVSNEVKYVGICPKTNLSKRMGTQRRNKCMPILIQQVLNAHEQVKIFALKPGKIDYGDIKVLPYFDLEIALIERLKPVWNDKLKKNKKSQIVNSKNNNL